MSCYQLLLWIQRRRSQRYLTKPQRGLRTLLVGYLSTHPQFSPTQMRMREGWKYYLWRWILPGQNRNVFWFWNYLVVCIIQLVNKILSKNNLLSIFINYLLKELASVIITIVNPFCSPFLKGVLECKNNLIFRSWMMLPNQFKILILVWNYFNVDEWLHHIVNNLALSLFIVIHKFKVLKAKFRIINLLTLFYTWASLI